MKLLFYLILLLTPLAAEQTDCDFLTKNFEKRLHIFVNEHSRYPEMTNKFEMELKRIDLHFPGVKTLENYELREKLYTRYFYDGHIGWTSGNGIPSELTQLFSEEELATFTRQKKSSSVLTIASGVTLGVGLVFLLAAGIEAGLGSSARSNLTTGAIVTGASLVGFTVAISLDNSPGIKTKKRMLENNSQVMRNYLKVQCP